MRNYEVTVKARSTYNVLATSPDDACEAAMFNFEKDWLNDLEFEVIPCAKEED